MSENIETVLIVQVATLLTVIVKGIFEHYAHREVKANFQKIENATNGMKDALIESTAIASKAEGVTQGIAQERGDRILREDRERRIADE